jgi:hypothetical protein
MRDYYTTWQGCKGLQRTKRGEESDLKWNGGDFGQNNYHPGQTSLTRSLIFTSTSNHTWAPEK